MPSAVPISKKLVLINSASSILTRLLNVGVVLWWMQHLLKRVPPEEYALLPVLIAVMAFVPLLNTVLTSGLSRYVTEALARNDHRRITEITSSMAPLLFGTGLLLLVGGLILAWFVDVVPNIRPNQISDARLMMALMMLQVALTMMLAPFGVGMFVRQRFVLRNILELGATLLRVLLLLVLLLGIGPEVRWVVVAQFGAAVVHLLVRTAVSRRILPALRFRFDHMRRDVVWPILGFNIWNLLMQVAVMIRDAANTLVLQTMTTPVDVNAFALGGRVEKQIREMSTIATEPVQPVLTALHVTAQRDRLVNAYVRGGRVATWAVMSVAVPVLVFREELFAVYLGDRFDLYRDCVTVTLLLMLGYPLLYPRVMLHKIAVAEGRIAAIALGMIFTHLLNLSLAIYLVGWRGMGAVGPAAATFTATTITNFGFFWPLGIRRFNVPLGRFLRDTVWVSWFPVLAGTATCELSRQLIHPQGWVELFVAGGLGMIGYIVVLWLFCLQPADRQDLARVWSRISRRG